MYKAFRTDSGYLTKYHLKSLLVFLLLDVGLALFAPPSWSIGWKEFALFVPGILLLSSTNFLTVAASSVYCMATSIYTFGFHLNDLACVALSVIVCLTATAILHNASHGNIRPKWLGRAIGELFGFIQLVGFADWTVIHIIHHANPDDPERDPHPPLGLSYWQFLNGMRKTILQVLLKEYFALWGDNKDSRKQLVRLALASKFEQMAKISLWLLILKPEVFSWLFVPSIALKMMHYAWFNYATHSQDTGVIELKNLDSPIYKVANFFTFGLYYHKNHHTNPKLFNPSKMRVAAEPAPSLAVAGVSVQATARATVDANRDREAS